MGIFNFMVIVFSIFCTSLTVLANPPKTQQSELTTATVNSGGTEIIADSIGKTLYVFDYDLHKPSPTCAENCAEVWPPYLITAEESLHLQKPLGMIKRTDGKIQLTYKDRPTYTYAYDRISGGDLGNGNNGVWHHIEFQTP
ncbi:MAG: COG4315 family predicted lipoprotein [Pseudobdellovibrionaceae bacterium]